MKNIPKAGIYPLSLVVIGFSSSPNFPAQSSHPNSSIHPCSATSRLSQPQVSPVYMVVRVGLYLIAIATSDFCVKNSQ